jgi:integrase
VKESDGGVRYLSISDLGEGKSVKTASSRRPVPIHPELVRLGFLSYVDGRRVAGDERVFPLLRQNSYGRWTQNWSKWWRTYARGTVGITDPRKVFHSFRHTFIRACRECGIEEEQRIAITGHAGGTVGRSYGGAYPLPALAGAMKRLRYAGLDLRSRWVQP